MSVAEKLLAEPLIKSRNMPMSFTICLPYVLAIPPKPPVFLLISKFTCYFLFPVSCIRSAARPPPKPPDMEAPAATS
ncbi:hypothetical protein A2U01_0055134 [Trifolium medium]|uniref:Uncharacterized protein n=1 Tax=Trifolium medium TaxID=97028 RepID=A0A392RDK4_9FABA|nr:hypothetical protein [Trifolium medium]